MLEKSMSLQTGKLYKWVGAEVCPVGYLFDSFYSNKKTQVAVDEIVLVLKAEQFFYELFFNNQKLMYFRGEISDSFWEEVEKPCF
jgi:hypothetical protein